MMKNMDEKAIVNLANATLQPDDILHFFDEQEKRRLALHSIEIRQHNETVLRTSWAPFRTEETHLLYSLSKTFTSLAIGFAVQEGILHLQDRIVDIFSDLLTLAPSAGMQEVTIHHLLSMNSGHEKEPAIFHLDEDLAKRFLESYIRFDPGAHFCYNTAGTYMLSAALQKKAGCTLTEYLQPRLFEPLGFSPEIWSQQSPDGVDAGGFGMNVNVVDIAKMGQFILNKGKWAREVLLEEAWFDRMMHAWSDNYATGGRRDWGSGYGYQMWKCAWKDAWRGDGMHGQLCVVIPSLDAVVAVTAGVSDMQAEMDLITDCLLEPMAGKTGEGASAEDQTAMDRLWERLANLQHCTGIFDSLDRMEGNGMNPVPIATLIADLAGTYITGGCWDEIKYPRIETLRILPQADRLVLEIIDESAQCTKLDLRENIWADAVLQPSIFNSKLFNSPYFSREKVYGAISVKLLPCTKQDCLQFDLIMRKSPAAQRWTIRKLGADALVLTVQDMVENISGNCKVLLVRSKN